MELELEAGAIVIKGEIANEMQVLLVRSKKQPDQWIFPKGHIEEGETIFDAAKRELLEEGGVEGAPIEKVGVANYSRDNRFFQVDYVICRFQKTIDQGEPGRTPTWFHYQEAFEKLAHKDTGEFLLEWVRKQEKKVSI